MSGRFSPLVAAILTIALARWTWALETPTRMGGSARRADKHVLSDIEINTARAEKAPPVQERPRRPVKRASETQPRFFFAGDGHLVLSHGHFNTTLNVRYRRADGTYDPAALAEIQRFFRSREDGREGAIALRLIELLAYVQHRFHPRQMTLLSGYRSPEFNEDLRAAGQQVAQASLHTQGLAADVTFTGLDMHRLWQQLRDLGSGGAGFYRSGRFLHIDTGQPRFWEETTSRVGENLSADNARVFARTDFDRYTTIDGALCTLHSVTAFPILIAARARLVGEGEATAITVEPGGGLSVDTRDGCYAITAPADAYRFRVHSSSPVAAGTRPNARQKMVLSTCEPRIGRTPAEIESNPIEVEAHHP